MFCYVVVRVLSKNSFNDDSKLLACNHTISSGDREKDPPVLIPNTEVKLLIVENTWLVTAREDRTLLDNYVKATLGSLF